MNNLSFWLKTGIVTIYPTGKKSKASLELWNFDFYENKLHHTRTFLIIFQKL